VIEPLYVAARELEDPNVMAASCVALAEDLIRALR
jgi:hypothetical protein